MSQRAGNPGNAPEIPDKALVQGKTTFIMWSMNNASSEKLLATVQELRNYLRAFPASQADFNHVQQYWLASQLFPPNQTLLHQALSVLVNAGELRRVSRQGAIQYRAPGARSQTADISA